MRDVGVVLPCSHQCRTLIVEADRAQRPIRLFQTGPAAKAGSPLVSVCVDHRAQELPARGHSLSVMAIASGIMNSRASSPNSSTPPNSSKNEGCVGRRMRGGAVGPALSRLQTGYGVSHLRIEQERSQKHAVGVVDWVSRPDPLREYVGGVTDSCHRRDQRGGKNSTPRCIGASSGSPHRRKPSPARHLSCRLPPGVDRRPSARSAL